MIKNLSDSELNAKIDTWISIVKEICASLNIERYQLISDTLFIGVGEDEEDLCKIVSAGRELLNKCVIKSIPLRGAISFGNYTWSDDLVYGKAVINAHELEMNQDWVGISCVEGIKIPNSCNYLICYSIPLKQGVSRVGVVITWDVPSYTDLASYLSKGGLAKTTDALKADWFTRIEKTILFSMYIKVSEKYGFPEDKFGGFSPLHAINEHFEKTL